MCSFVSVSSQYIDVIRNIGGITVQTLGFSLAIVLGLATIRDGGTAISARSKSLISWFLYASFGAIAVWIAVELQQILLSQVQFNLAGALILQLVFVIGLVIFLALAVFDVLKRYV